MRNKINTNPFIFDARHQQENGNLGKNRLSENNSKLNIQSFMHEPRYELAEILFITSYPPRECGIATYSQDLIKALNNKFSSSLSLKVCALESGNAINNYPDEVKYKLDTSQTEGFYELAKSINQDNRIKIVLIQHEFGFFKMQERSFINFLYELSKPIVVVFHSVLPNPDELQLLKIKNIAAVCSSIVVMTHNSAGILTTDYGLPSQKISVIPHGIHLVSHLSENLLKIKYGLRDRKVLTTFGLLSSGKSIETTLEALPAIVKQCSQVVFLVIGKTHPEVIKSEGEKYRESLEQKVKQYSLEKHVIFINDYLSLPELLDYLQLTDIYIFTTNDPNQAVSGTFAYAMSCACPIISTPIPHAREVLNEETGIIFDFCNSKQLAESVNTLLNDEPMRRNMSSNTLEKIVSTAWENSAIAHAMLFEEITNYNIGLKYDLPLINMRHVKQMTTHTGIIQFSKINQPDIDTGYTLDDNARALITMCMHYKLTSEKADLVYIQRYLSFINNCQQTNGNFVNYIDKDCHVTEQNRYANLDDANGRAIWALGYLISLKEVLPGQIISEAKTIIENSMLYIAGMHSTRAMAFAVKGLYYYNIKVSSPANIQLIKVFANRLAQMYKHESSENWEWFEMSLTYANSILPEAMLYAWLLTDEIIYKEIAFDSFNFLLSQTFNKNGIEVISNKNWLLKGQKAGKFGEQPIDVAYTIMTLSKFYDVFADNVYLKKLDTAFNWFLGKNRLHQIIYNPSTGGCYDGLEETHVNLNQGAESTLSYLMARLTIENYRPQEKRIENQTLVHVPKKSKKEEVLIQLSIKNSSEQAGHYFITNASGMSRKEFKL